MRHGQMITTYRTHTTTDGSFKFLHLQVERMMVRDARRELRDCAEYATDAATIATHRERLAEVRAANDDCKHSGYYLASQRRTAVEFKWQANLDGYSVLERARQSASDWYGVSIERAEISAAVANAITRVAKLQRDDATPQQFVEALKAKPVRYNSKLHDYVLDGDMCEAEFESPREEAERNADPADDFDPVLDAPIGQAARQ